jgi:hypothetical protein
MDEDFKSQKGTHRRVALWYCGVYLRTHHVATSLQRTNQ